jgi:hypothetical protein
LVKIPREELGGKRLMAVEVGLEITRGREEFEKRLEDVVAGIRT